MTDTPEETPVETPAQLAARIPRNAFSRPAPTTPVFSDNPEETDPAKLAAQIPRSIW